MIKLATTVLIYLAIPVGVFAANSCYSADQVKDACSKAMHLSILPEFLTNLASKIDNSMLQLIISQTSDCPIDTTNAKTMAKVFNFRTHYPDGRQENVTGLEFMEKCQNPSKSQTTFSSTVYLWYGWLVGCESVKGLYNMTTANWGSSVASDLASKSNAMVIEIDWGTSNASCCNYLQLAFCFQDFMVDWMADQVINCAENGILAPIQNTSIVGHSMGAQFGGATAQTIKEKTGEKLYKAIALDAAGPFYESESESGRCQGMQPDTAEHTIAMHTNPKGFGTDMLNIAQINVLSNAKEDFCQHDVGCDPISCHTYSMNPLFNLLVHEAPLKAVYLNDVNGPMQEISIFNEMKSGIYSLEANDNPALLNPDGYLSTLKTSE